MKLKILPEGLAELLIRGEEDMLTPKAEEERVMRATIPCPRCGGAFHKNLDPNRAFSPERALPRYFHRCVDCGYTYDPISNIVIDYGNPARVEDPFKIDID